MLAGLVGRRDLRARFGDPIVVGGTGGSGTRSVSQLLARAGVVLGTRLNAEQDAEYLTSFDWRYGRSLLASALDAPAEPGGADGHARHDRAFRRAVRAHLSGSQPLAPGAAWGWKHPHSYLLLPYLRRQFPEMRFIHVVRDGRDMAFSGNQRQTHRYGPVLTPGAAVGPVGSAAYWSAANLYAAAGGAAMGDAYLVIRLEDLCAEPTKTTHGLLRWAGLISEDTPVDDVSWAEQIVRAPLSLGRWRTSEYERIDEVSAAAAPGLAAFGYTS